MLCPSCGSENRDGARFCDSCAAALTTPTLPHEQRKTVTVLFAMSSARPGSASRSIPSSTAHPVALLRRMTRNHRVARRHGREVHRRCSDGRVRHARLARRRALRAVRAANEMSDALPELGNQRRIGVNTGEVVAGTEERLVTGDAVNVAAASSRRPIRERSCLVRDLSADEGAAVVDGLAPRDAQGEGWARGGASLDLRPRTEPSSETRPERWSGALVSSGSSGSAFDRTMSGAGMLALHGARYRRCRQVAARGGVPWPRATTTHVVRARCLPYGEGITFWPVVEVGEAAPRGSTSIPPQPRPSARSSENQKLVDLERGDRVGVPQAARSGRRERNLSCACSTTSTGARRHSSTSLSMWPISRATHRILMLCMARPDILDRRTGWGGGKVNATTVLLEPLAPAETALLIESLAPVGRAPSDADPGGRRRQPALRGGDGRGCYSSRAMTRSSFRPRFRRCSRPGWISSIPGSGMSSSAARSKGERSTRERFERSTRRRPNRQPA